MKCLEKRPADRWQSADELLAQLEPLATPSGGTTPTSTRPVLAAVIRAPARKFVVGAALLAAAAVGVVLLTRPRAPDVSLGRRRQVTLDPGLEIDPALSPDGKLIAYAAGAPGRMHLYVRQLDGGAPVRVVRDTSGFQRHPYWSPDGTRLLFASDHGIEMAPALGGASRLLVPPTPVLAGPIAPDGRSFLYASSDSLYVRPLEGGPARLITTGFEPHSFAWSPDGSRIAYVSGNLYYIGDANLGNLAPSSIWVVPATGGTPRRVTDERSLNVSPVWAPDGRTLLFVSSRDGGRDVYAVVLTRSRRPAGRAVRLTTGANALAISLAANGRTLAYAAFTETSNVWSLPIPTGAPASVARAVPLTTGNQTIENFNVSPDGHWLAFDSNRNGVQQIFRVPVAGGEPEQLTSDSSDVFAPNYSADGREIGFHGFREGRRQAFVIAAAGGPMTQVTHVPGDERGPVWDDSGRRLLLGRDLSGERPRLDIVTRGPDGRWSEPRSVEVTVRLDDRALRCRVDDVWAWSPDEHWIAVTCGGKGPGLVLVSPESGATRLLVPDSPGHAAKSPAWSPDGRSVYYLAAGPTGVGSVNAVSAGGGTPRILVRFDEPSRPWHRYGFQARGGRFYFTLGDLQSDIWVAEVEQRR